MKGLYNFKVVIVFSFLDLNHHVNQETTLMMDGLDPLLPKNDGHDFLVVILFVNAKFIAILFKFPFFTTFVTTNQGSITIRSDNGAKFITMMMGSIPLFCFTTLNPIICCCAKFQVQNCQHQFQKQHSFLYSSLKYISKCL